MRFLLSILCILLASNLHSQTDSLNDLALSLFQKQEYAKALNIWEECLELDSMNLYCFQQAGISSYSLGMIPKAKRYFEKIEDDPQFFQTACINLANIYELQGIIPRAIKYNRRLKDSFPENPIYYRKLGALYLKSGVKSEAFSNYAKAFSLNSKDIISLKALSEIFISNNQFEDADSLLAIGIKLDSTDISLSLLRAKNFYSMKNYESTVVMFEDLKGRIDFTNYHNRMLGYALLQIDSLDEAIWYLEKSLIDESNPEFAHYSLANAYELKEETETAIFHYNKAIEAGASNGLHSYHRSLGRIHSSEKNLKECIENYKWAYKYREDPIILLYLAQASEEYYKDKSIAINYYNQYIKSDHSNQSYKKFAKERVQILKAYLHQRGL